jgi:mono/diheme cytochrome c family protein
LARVKGCTPVIFIANCSSQPKPKAIENPWSDDAIINMRHGWTIFSGPDRTLVGVNDEATVARGKIVYVKHYQQCHGEGGKGDGPLAKTKGLLPTNLASISKVLPNHYMVVQINDGRKNGMPSWSDILNNQEAWDVTNYLQVLGRTDRKK